MGGQHWKHNAIKMVIRPKRLRTPPEAYLSVQEHPPVLFFLYFIIFFYIFIILSSH